MDERLLRLADAKIEQLRHYNEITSQMIYEDIDGVGDLIDKRQEIITAMDGISVDIRRYVNDQSIERRDSINKILQSQEISDLNDDLIALQNKIREMKSIRDEISKNDKLAVERIKALRDEAYSELIRSAKNKRNIEYLSPNSQSKISNGGKFDASH